VVGVSNRHLVHGAELETCDGDISTTEDNCCQCSDGETRMMENTCKVEQILDGWSHKL